MDAFLPILRDAAWPVWGAVGHRRRDLRRCSYPAAGRTSSTALPFTRRPSSACAASATCSHAPRQPTSTASLLPRRDQLRAADVVQDHVDGLVDPVQTNHHLVGAGLGQALAAGHRADRRDDMRTRVRGQLHGEPTDPARMRR